MPVTPNPKGSLPGISFLKITEFTRKGDLCFCARMVPLSRLPTPWPYPVINA
jgi:hypothetical protein